jgi:hypothetical protein
MDVRSDGLTPIANDARPIRGCRVRPNTGPFLALEGRSWLARGGSPSTWAITPRQALKGRQSSLCHPILSSAHSILTVGGLTAIVRHVGGGQLAKHVGALERSQAIAVEVTVQYSLAGGEWTELAAISRGFPEGYASFVEGLPGASSQGETLEDARRNRTETARLVLEANRRQQESQPRAGM